MLENLQERLESKIKQTAIGKIDDFRKRIAVKNIHRRNFEKKTGEETEPVDLKEPRSWNVHQQFHPHSVRKRSSVYARQIAGKIRNTDYSPLPSLVTELPKDSGGSRPITVYGIPDACVSKLLFYSLYERNFQFFSENAYAYRREKSAHHAVRKLSRDRGRPRMLNR